MNKFNKNPSCSSISGQLPLAALIQLMFSVQAHSAEPSLDLLNANELDHVNAGGASATVHAYAGGLGIHTYANTGAITKVYVKNLGYLSVEMASALGGASAGGSVSEASVDIIANVSGNLTSSHTFSHSKFIAQTGFSYASGYTLLVSYTRN